MNNYFASEQYREDYNNVLKALLLLSKKIESLSTEIRQLRTAQTMNLTNAPHMPVLFPDDEQN
jgi:hypothetical protein